jgi:hypothetical protein
MIILKKNDDFFSFAIGKSAVPVEESLIPYLSDDIQLENGVTFGQFFSIILKHHEEYSEFFNSFMGGVPLSDFISEFNATPKIEEVDDMDYVCVRWGITYVFPDEFNKPIYIRKIAEFNGFQYKQNAFSDGGYSLEFSPLNKLKKYPFKLIKNHVIADMNSTKTLFTLDRNFLVFDVLISIFNEITFMGTPSEREEVLEKLKSRLDESVKNYKENKVKSISLEDVLKKMKIDPPRVD